MMGSVLWKEQLQKFLDRRKTEADRNDSQTRDSVLREIRKDTYLVAQRQEELSQRAQQVERDLRDTRQAELHTPMHSPHYLPIIQRRRDLAEKLTLLQGELRSLRLRRKALYHKSRFIELSGGDADL